MPSPDGSPLVTRFAPSPTGHLHVGGARTALFCWAFAKAEATRLNRAGRFMIRIEDTDAARSSDESARGILDDLAWLGIPWDDGPEHRPAPSPTNPHPAAIGHDGRPVGPYFQARRVDIYNAYIEHLFSIGRAYPAFESPEELERDRKAAAAKKATYKYPRPADIVPGTPPTARLARARGSATTPPERHVVRFVMPDHGLTVNDRVLGPVSFAPGEVDDFVIRKADGFPTYHFAVVIDDELMGVTHVLRAQEHLINTPRHVALQGALSRLVDDHDAAKGILQHNAQPVRFRTPDYAHMPLICNIDGTKMSKRDKAKAARKALKDALARDPGLTLDSLAARAGNIDVPTLRAFAEADNDKVEIAEALAAPLAVNLPEIEVWDYRAGGYLPEALINFLALLGWNPGQKTPDGKDLERFDAPFIARHFSLDRIGKSSAKFDRAKLLNVNAEYIAALSDTDYDTRVRAWAAPHNPPFAARWAALDDARRTLLIRAARARTKTLAELPRVIAFALTPDDELAFDPAALAKHMTPAGRETLSAFAAFLASSPPPAAPPPAPTAHTGTPSALDAWIKARAEATGQKMGDVAQPIRIALTGTTVSPPLGDTLAILGIPSAARRVERCRAL